MDVEFSFFSTSMIGVEGTWIGIFTILQIGGHSVSSTTFWRAADVCWNSGQYLCHLERTSRILRDEGPNFGLRLDYSPGSCLLDGRDVV